MGPPTNVDGERGDIASQLESAFCFNGAADKRRRRAAVTHGEHVGLLAASMGPPTNVDGESTVDTDTRVGDWWLQWGRRQTSTER